MSRDLFEKAYRSYWDAIERRDFSDFDLHSYDLCEVVNGGVWHTPFAELMVGGELRESINQMNSWSGSLFDLRVWASVLEGFSEDDAWSLRDHFVEPLVYFCMHQPSAVRDRFGQVATNAIHQANLSVDKEYADVLEQDALKPGRFLRRGQLESQLERLSSRWVAGKSLLEELRKLDSNGYRKSTLDYRNRASHFIAPRLELGEVQHLTRSVGPATVMVKATDGYFYEEVDPGRMCVSYGFGGISPLRLAEVIEHNSKEYKAASRVLEAYSDLIREVMGVIGSIPRSKEL